MGKRSNFKRMKNDFYETPEKAVIPLLPHLKSNSKFIEPCAGHGALIKILEKYEHNCVYRSDFGTPAPRGYFNHIADATYNEYIDHYNDEVDYFITNPPWTRSILHPIIENLSNQQKTWLLFDANWLFTKQAAPYLTRLRKVVIVGRLKWIPDSKYISKDDCCWYLFDTPNNDTSIEFIGKQ